MMARTADIMFVVATILLSVYGQVALKWRMNAAGDLQQGGSGSTLWRLIMLLFDPIIASTFIAAFVASLAWMMALTKFVLCRIYPLTSLNFVLVLLLSAAFLGERLDWAKIVGVALIVVGTVVVSGSMR